MGVPLAAAAPILPAAPKAVVPIISSDATVIKELLELDRVLDANPAFEEVLRKNIDRLEEESLRKNSPDIDVLIKRQGEPLRLTRDKRV